jgi:hypothetical protein
MGMFRLPGERFTVCDLFDFARDEETIRPGARKAYQSLTQDMFERNYLAFHDELPIIVRGLTETIVDHVAPESCRFIHIDASHMYDHVHGDSQAAQMLLRPDGIVVFDDYRTEHCPGTAAAVWQAMATQDLKAICVSANKFYGTWGDQKRIQDDLIEYVSTLSDHRCDIQQVMGQRLIRLAKVSPKAAPAAPAKAAPANLSDPAALLAQSQQVLQTAQRILRESPQVPAQPGRPSVGSAWRRMTVAVLPPVVTGIIRQRRSAARKLG